MGISEAVIEGEMDAIVDLVNSELESGRDANDILREMIKGMEEVGERFERKEYYVPETLLSAHTMMMGLEIIRPHLEVGRTDKKVRVIIGSVESDIHDIGLNLVSMFLEAAGFEIHNLGKDVPTSRFIEKTEELKPEIIGLSAMMSTTALKVKEVIEEFEKKNLKNGIYFVVGGAALSEDFAREIGANGYASDARKAVKVFEELLEGRSS